MLSNRWSKIIKSLQIKKFRKEQGLFLIEGEKSLIELLGSDFEIEELFLTEKFIEKHDSLLQNKDYSSNDEATIKKNSSLVTNDAGIAVVKIKNSELVLKNLNSILVLDNVQDPGNLGTIIRAADWYGIDAIICSPSTVDHYNFKVVQAAMGSLFRTTILYTDLPAFIENNNSQFKFYTATLNGENIHQIPFNETKTAIVMGNESKGVSEEVIELCEKEIMIPRFGGAESLNVAMATSIICDNYRRVKPK